MSRHHSPRIVTDGLITYLDPANKRSYAGSGTSSLKHYNSKIRFFMVHICALKPIEVYQNFNAYTAKI